MRQDYAPLTSKVLEYLANRDAPMHGFTRAIGGIFEYDLPKWLENYNKELFLKEIAASGWQGVDQGYTIENLPLPNLIRFLYYCMRNSTVLFPWDVEENEEHNKQIEERQKEDGN